MTHRSRRRGHGRATAWRAAPAGFADNNMHAEVVNGMNVLAVRDAVQRAAEALPRRQRARCLLDVDCYRYWGHSLSDPRNEYRTKEEEAAWKAIDPIETYKKELLEAGVLDAKGIAAVEKRVVDRNARAAKRAAAAADPDAKDVLDVHVHRHEVRDRAGRVCQGGARRPAARDQARQRRD